MLATTITPLEAIGLAGVAALAVVPAWAAWRNATGVKPRRLAAGAVAWLVAAALGGAVCLGAMRYFGSPAPLGVALPAIPRLFTTAGVDYTETSVIDGRVAENWLEFLAPQPDGSAPLRYTFSCEMADFSIRLPMGTQSAAFPGEQVLKDGLLAVSQIQLGQAVREIRYMAPFRRDGEKLNEYVARLRHELELRGARFHDFEAPAEVNGYRLLSFAYELPAEQGEPELHCTFFGRYGKRALTIDFQTTAALRQRAEPMVLKILGSFKPGERLLEFQDMPVPPAGADEAAEPAAVPQ